MDNQKFLVQGTEIDGAEFARIMTAGQVFSMMDKADCTDTEITDIWALEGCYQAPTECSFLGKWHDRNDPQLMVIVGNGKKWVGHGIEH